MATYQQRVQQVEEPKVVVEIFRGLERKISLESVETEIIITNPQRRPHSALCPVAN